MSRYELLERIGAGGMAEIFRGRAIAMGGFEKLVAIKKILPHLGRDDRFVRMLIVEAKTLATLRQRNIVQIYDVGLGEDGEYFLVMEYVDGRDLGALFERMERDRGRLAPDLALHIGAEVCEALDHAHRATDASGKPLGLIHRDISPSNVLLSRSGEVKLTDFGIAKNADQASLVGPLAGKFAYMSPEQARAERLDPSSDVYSLGVVLWELLTGRRLYSGAKDFDALRLVREARVPRPSEVEPTFSRELEGLLMKALAPDPRQRWAGAAPFGAALRDYRYSAKTSAGDPSKEIATLVHHYFPPPGAGTTQEHKVVRITTVAGFVPPPAAPVLPPGAVAAGRGVNARAIFDAFDDPTRHEPELAARLAAEEALALDVTSTTSRAVADPTGTGLTPATADATLEQLLDATAFDPTRQAPADDADTREIDLRSGRAGGRDATPTVRDFPTEALFDRLEGPDPAAAAALGEIDLVSATRRRAVLWAIVITVVTALLAFIIAGTLVAGDDDEGGGRRRPAEVTPGSGEALDVPAIQPPVKKPRPGEPKKKP